MVGKVMVRKSFNNVVKYVIDKEKNAQIIAENGILTNDTHSIIDSFEVQVSMRPNLKNKVGHIALSFSPKDKLRCTNEFMSKVAEMYMDKMGISNTQYIVVRHSDHEHPHIHIVYNRVDNNGKTISDNNQRLKNVKVCKALTHYYGLYVSAGKKEVRRERLRQPDKSRYAIYDAITEILPNCYSWKQFREALSEKDISVELVFKGDTVDVQGIIFSLDGYRFNGSKIDRKYSFSKLQKQILKNNEKKKQHVSRQQTVNRVSKTSTIQKGNHVHFNSSNLLSPTSGGYSRNAEYEVGNNDSEENEEYRRRKGGYSM